VHHRTPGASVRFDTTGISEILPYGSVPRIRTTPEEGESMQQVIARSRSWLISGAGVLGVAALALGVRGTPGPDTNARPEGWIPLDRPLESPVPPPEPDAGSAPLVVASAVATAPAAPAHVAAPPRAVFLEVSYEPGPVALLRGDAAYGFRGPLARELARYRTAGDDADTRQDALLELALSDEPAALVFLLDELNAAPEGQRSGLIEAVIQYGSRDAIPELYRLARAATDPGERRALLDAAAYLTLPSLTELRLGLWKPDAAAWPR
jgi:hypothetical protein